MSQDIRTTKLRKWVHFCLYLALTVLVAVAIAAVAEYMCEIGEADDLYAVTMGFGIVALGFVGFQAHRQYFNSIVEARVQKRLREELRRHAVQLASGVDELQRDVEALSSEMHSGVVACKFPVRALPRPSSTR